MTDPNTTAQGPQVKTESSPILSAPEINEIPEIIDLDNLPDAPRNNPQNQQPTVNQAEMDVEQEPSLHPQQESSAEMPGVNSESVPADRPQAPMNSLNEHGDVIVHPPKFQAPDDVAAARMELYEVFRRAWTSSDINYFNDPKIIHDLAHYNQRCTGNSEQFMIQSKTMADIITGISSIVNVHPPFSQTTLREQVNKTATLYNTVGSIGASWKDIVGEPYYVLVENFARDFTNGPSNLESLLTELMKPTPVQSRHLSSVRGSLDVLMMVQGADVTSCLNRLEEIDRKLIESNLGSKVRDGDVSLPWKYIASAVCSGNTQSTAFAELHFYLTCMGVPGNISNAQSNLLSQDRGKEIFKERVLSTRYVEQEKKDALQAIRSHHGLESRNQDRATDEKKVHFTSSDGLPQQGNASQSHQTSNDTSKASNGGDADNEGLLITMEMPDMYPEGVPKTTVAWGYYAGGRVFYINKVGYTGGSAYRRDTTPCGPDIARWERLDEKDSIKYDRFGDKRNGTKKVYTRRHIAGIGGVVLDILKYGTVDKALQALNPNIDKDYWDVTPVLTVWRPSGGLQGPTVRRWETRGCFRDRTRKNAADLLIYQAAMVQEQNLTNLVRRTRSPSAGLIPNQMNNLRAESLPPQHASIDPTRPVPSVEEPRGFAQFADRNNRYPTPASPALRSFAPEQPWNVNVPPPIFSSHPRTNTSQAPSSAEEMLLKSYLQDYNCTKVSDLPFEVQKKYFRILKEAFN
ncbi:unnamed protein product [Periconia digitata]|uniref:Uncharacterized protein n=1 Tax=Periconia digitata TaxID=1303443 RepID=A0A9W4ULE0_9PLEO|nr:unnamed protein product [Periconia digitata]